MGKYNDFLEAYRKAYPEIMKNRQYEQANKEWNVLKKDPKFDEKFKEKMTELKSRQYQIKGKNIKLYTQAKLTFVKSKAPVQDSNIKQDHQALPVLKEAHNGRFLKSQLIDKRCIKNTTDYDL